MESIIIIVFSKLPLSFGQILITFVSLHLVLHLKYVLHLHISFCQSVVALLSLLITTTPLCTTTLTLLHLSILARSGDFSSEGDTRAQPHCCDLHCWPWRTGYGAPAVLQDVNVWRQFPCSTDDHGTWRDVWPSGQPAGVYGWSLSNCLRSETYKVHTFQPFVSITPN